MIYILLHSVIPLTDNDSTIAGMKKIIHKIYGKENDWVIAKYNTWTSLKVNIGELNHKSILPMVKNLITRLTPLCGDIHFNIIDTTEARSHVYTDRLATNIDPNTFCAMGPIRPVPGTLGTDWINYLTPTDRNEMFECIYKNILSPARIVLYHKRLIVTVLEDFGLLTGEWENGAPKYVQENTTMLFNGQTYYLLLRNGRDIVVDCAYDKAELRISPYYVLMDYLKTCRQYKEETRKVIYRHEPIDTNAINALNIVNITPGVIEVTKNIKAFDASASYDGLYGNFIISTDIEANENLEGFLKLRLLHSGDYRRLFARPNINRVCTLLRKIFETGKSLTNDEVLEISKFNKESPSKMIGDLRKEIKKYNLETNIMVGENIDQDSLFDKAGVITVNPFVKYTYCRPADDTTVEGGK